MYGAKVIIELVELGDDLNDAIKKVNKFLDWCDKESSPEFTYETTDYEITVDTKQAVDWYREHVIEEEYNA